MTIARQLKLRVKKEIADILTKIKKKTHLRNKTLSRRLKILPTSGSQLVGMGGKERDLGKRMKGREDYRKRL